MNSQRRRESRPLLKSTLVTSIVTVLVVIAILDGPIESAVRLFVDSQSLRYGPSVFFVRMTLAEIALLIAVISILVDRRNAKRRKRHILRSSNTAGKVSINERFGINPAPREIMSAVLQAQARYFNSTIGIFSSMLADHPHYLTRTVEHFTLFRGHARKVTRIEYVITSDDKDSILARALEPLLPIPNGNEAGEDSDKNPRPPLANPQSAVLVVPIMFIRKGTLLPGLRISDPAGTRLYELSQDETMGLTAMALSSYFEEAFENVRAPSSEELYTDEADKALWRLRQIVFFRGVVTTDQIGSEFDLATANLEPRDEEMRARLRTFCMFFADSYFMACEVPLPQGYSVIVEISTDVSTEAENFSREQRLRAFFSMEPYRYQIPLESVTNSSNYHAELDGGDHAQYVYMQQVADEQGRHIDDHYFREDDERRGQVIYQSETDRVAPRINIRNFFDPAAPKLMWNVALEELPPGAFAPVLALSLITTSLTSLFSFIVPQIASQDFDGPALVVAIPLFVVTFFGFSFDRLSRSSLPAVYGFVSSSILTVTCAILVLVSTDAGPGVVHDPSLFGSWHIPSFSWPLLVCGLASLVTTINLLFLVYRRVRRYAILTNRAAESTS